MRTFVLLLLLLASAALAQADGTAVRKRDLVGGSSSLLPSSLQATSTALNYYVTSAGSDANTCLSAGSPCLTVQGAVNKIPKRVRHAVTINIGAGNFAGFSVTGFTLEYPAGGGAAGSYLMFLGTLATATVATGTASGTLTSAAQGSGSAHATLTDSGQTWTVDNLKGKMIEVTQSGEARNYVIVSNTATQITIAGYWISSAPSGAYTVRDWGTVINTTVASIKQPQPSGNASTGTANVYVWGNTSETLLSQVFLMNLAFSPSSVTGVFAEGGSYTYVVQCKVTTGSGGVGMQSYGSPISFTRNYVLGSGASVGVLGGGGTFTSVTRNYFNAGAYGIQNNYSASLPTFSTNVFDSQTTAGISLSGNGQLFLQNNRFLSDAIGLSAQTQTLFTGASAIGVIMAGNDFTSCTTGAKLSGLVYGQTTGTTTGATNTTVFNVLNGAALQLSSTDSVTGTTEVSLDGTAYTIAQMRGMTPKIISNTYGSKVFQ